MAPGSRTKPPRSVTDAWYAWLSSRQRMPGRHEATVRSIAARLSAVARRRSVTSASVFTARANMSASYASTASIPDGSCQGEIVEPSPAAFELELGYGALQRAAHVE